MRIAVVVGLGWGCWSAWAHRLRTRPRAARMLSASESRALADLSAVLRFWGVAAFVVGPLLGLVGWLARRTSVIGLLTTT